MLNPYELLGVKQGDSINNIKKQYKKLLTKYHPDHCPNHMESLYKTNLIIKAFHSIMSEYEHKEILKNSIDNQYKVEDKVINLYLKKEYQSILTILEKDDQIYKVKFNKNDIKPIFYKIKIFYYQKTETFKAIFKMMELSKPILIKNSKRIILKGKGSFYKDRYKNLVIFTQV